MSRSYEIFIQKQPHALSQLPVLKKFVSYGASVRADGAPNVDVGKRRADLVSLRPARSPILHDVCMKSESSKKRLIPNRHHVLGIRDGESCRYRVGHRAVEPDGRGNLSQRISQSCADQNLTPPTTWLESERMTTLRPFSGMLRVSPTLPRWRAKSDLNVVVDLISTNSGADRSVMSTRSTSILLSSR